MIKDIEKMEDTMTKNKIDECKEDQEWQKQMMPLMSRMIIALAIFFFIASLGQLIYLHISIENVPKIAITESFEGLPESSELAFAENLELTRFKAMYMLETNTMELRHHQANVLLMSRVWARYMGFVTGMILALVGAVFILGKLREPKSEISTKTEVMTVSLVSASPGIILTVLGVILMLITIITHHEISITDVPVYITRNGLVLAQTSLKDKPKLELPKFDSSRSSTNSNLDNNLSE